MSDREGVVSRLIADRDFRADYIRAKLEVLIPSQLRALRLHQHKTQPELAQMADMKQSRISAMETPGKVNFNQETLVRMAATLSVGMKVEFVPFSEMLEWENGYNQDTFDVTRLWDDVEFLESKPRTRRKRSRKQNPRTPWSCVAEVMVSPIAGLVVSPSDASIAGQGTQMKLDSALSGSSLPDLPESRPLGNVIVWPSRPVVNDIVAAAVANGAGRNYGR